MSDQKMGLRPKLTPAELTEQIEKVGWNPVEDKILLMRDDAENISKGGIIIPGNSKEKPYRGHILAMGPECFRDAHTGKVHKIIELEVGMRVLYGKYAGSAIPTKDGEHQDDEKYIIMRAQDIIGYLKD